MAEKTTTSRGRKANTATSTIAETKKAEVKTQTEIELEETKKALAEMQKMLEEMKSANNQTVVIQKDNSARRGKIKCISLSPNPVNVATRPNFEGRGYTFKEYGSKWEIKADDLEDIISSYPKTMESGLIYICDRDFAEEQGLTEKYADTILTKELMDELVYLRRDLDVEVLLALPTELLEATIIRIVQLYKANEHFDANVLEKIKNETGYDIVEMSTNALVK